MIEETSRRTGGRGKIRKMLILALLIWASLSMPMHGEDDAKSPVHGLDYIAFEGGLQLTGNRKYWTLSDLEFVLMQIDTNTIRIFKIEPGALIDREAISLLGDMPQLSLLQISDQNLADDDLAFLKENKKLRILRVAGNKLTGDFLQYLRGHNDLKILRMGENPISDKKILLMPVLLSLGEIDISRSEITDLGVVSLLRQPKLTRISVEETAVTELGVRELLSSRKNMVVYFGSGAGFKSLNNLLPAPGKGSDSEVDPDE